MENRSHALIAGIFTLGLLLAAGLALWWLGGAEERSNTYLLTTRGSVPGLNVEAQVRYRGIRAGKVKRIYPDSSDPATLLVEITLQRQFALTDQARARLDYQGLTGIAYVMIEEGEGGQLLDPDGPAPPRLPLAPGLFARLGDQAGDIGRHFAELGGRLNRALDDRNLANLAHSLDRLAAASEGLQRLPALLARLEALFSEGNLARVSAVLARLEAGTGELAPLGREARSLLGELAGLGQRLDLLARRADAVGGRLDAETLPAANALLREATRSAARLERLLDTLEAHPQALLFGAPPTPPGPGEVGFVPPAIRE